ncbi:BTB/POZ domain-containing protein [Platanthera zijinensis]|uniref:BTB/POZ domain-containing protein n=1 Tax=Platanthera zijinensis TaxID=2320716 RepID=A0AAP0BR66_9ASPA
MISGSCGSSVGGFIDSKVETIARLAQWRIDNFGPYPTRRSEAFKLGIWNWYLSVDRNRSLCIRLYPEPCRITKEQPPFAKFIFRVSNFGPGRRSCVSPVFEKVLRTSEDIVWHVDGTFQGRLSIDVEFLELKIFPINGGEPSSIWPNKEMMFHTAKSGLNCLSRMLEEEMHADVTIKVVDGIIKAHKAVLSACSPVFESMFLHDLKEKESSLIDIDDMSLESCSVLLRYIYGSINQDDFWAHRLSLLGAANKYDIAELKDCCEESLLEDINTGNVLERLEAAWLYQLDKLKRGCLAYLFDFGKIHDVRDEIKGFFGHVDRELMLDMFQEIITLWRPA